jgi:hypothetical protein
MERERLRVFGDNSKERKHYKDYFLGSIRSYMISCYWQARERYVDNLTKRQQNAINLIRILEPGDFVESIGGRMSGHNGWVYILDC